MPDKRTHSLSVGRPSSTSSEPGARRPAGRGGLAICGLHRQQRQRQLRPARGDGSARSGRRTGGSGGGTGGDNNGGSGGGTGSGGARRRRWRGRRIRWRRRRRGWRDRRRHRNGRRGRRNGRRVGWPRRHDRYGRREWRHRNRRRRRTTTRDRLSRVYGASRRSRKLPPSFRFRASTAVPRRTPHPAPKPPAREYVPTAHVVPSRAPVTSAPLFVAWTATRRSPSAALRPARAARTVHPCRRSSNMVSGAAPSGSTTTPPPNDAATSRSPLDEARSRHGWTPMPTNRRAHFVAPPGVNAAR